MAARMHSLGVKSGTGLGRPLEKISASNSRSGKSSLRAQRSQLRATRRELREQARALRCELKSRKQRRDDIKNHVHGLRDQLDDQRRQVRTSQQSVSTTFQETRAAVLREFQNLQPKCKESAIEVERVSQRIIQTLENAVEAVESAVEASIVADAATEDAKASQATKLASAPVLANQLDEPTKTSHAVQEKHSKKDSEWIAREIAKLTSLTSLTEEETDQLQSRLGKPVRETLSAAQKCHKLAAATTKTARQLKTARRQLQLENQSISRVENDITCIEARIALLESQIQCIEFIIESMEREAEEAEKAFRDRQERLLVKEAEDKEKKAAQRQKQLYTKLQDLADQLTRREYEYRQAQRFNNKAESKDELESIRVSLEQTREALRRIDNEQFVKKDATQIRREIQTRAECQIESAISFLRTLLGSGKDAFSSEGSIPSGVRMSSTLMVALDELDDLARCNASEHSEEQNRTNQAARSEVIAALKQGTVPDPMHILALAEQVSAPNEWLTDLKSWSQELQELSLEEPRHGQLKGVIEQKKISVIDQFVAFLERIGSSNVRAILNGDSLDYTRLNFSKQSVANMNNILDNLFAK